MLIAAWTTPVNELQALDAFGAQFVELLAIGFLVGLLIMQVTLLASFAGWTRRRRRVPQVERATQGPPDRLSLHPGDPRERTRRRSERRQVGLIREALRRRRERSARAGGRREVSA